MFVLFIITQADFQMALRHDSGRWDAARDGKAWVEIFELYNLDQNGAELLATRSRKHTVLVFHLHGLYFLYIASLMLLRLKSTRTSVSL